MKTLPQHAERKHSRLAPSNSSVWINCSASVPFCEDNEDRLPPETSSKYADEGTLAHEVSDCLMKGQRVPAGATRDMLDHGAGYKRFCLNLTEDREIWEHCVELEVPLFYLPEENGHVDYFRPDRAANHIHVVDYKYGAGIPVSAEWNTQMTIYGMSAIKDKKKELFWVKDDTLISLHIYQPRCKKEEGEGPVSTWTVRFDQLSLFAFKDIAVPAELILSNARHLLKFAPSDKTCRWCRAAAFCGARSEELITGVPVVRKMSEPTPISPAEPQNISDDQLVSILDNAPALKKWLEQCQDYAFKRAMAGNPIPGTKLVVGKGSRSWTDEEEAARLLKKVGLNPHKIEIISPFQAEEEMKHLEVSKKLKTMISSLILRNPGGPNLANAKSTKTDWVPVLAENEFEVIGDELTLQDLLG